MGHENGWMQFGIGWRPERCRSSGVRCRSLAYILGALLGGWRWAGRAPPRPNRVGAFAWDSGPAPTDRGERSISIAVFPLCTSVRPTADLECCRDFRARRRRIYALPAGDYDDRLSRLANQGSSGSFWLVGGELFRTAGFAFVSGGMNISNSSFLTHIFDGEEGRGRRFGLNGQAIPLAGAGCYDFVFGPARGRGKRCVIRWNDASDGRDSKTVIVNQTLRRNETRGLCFFGLLRPGNRALLRGSAIFRAKEAEISALGIRLPTDTRSAFSRPGRAGRHRRSPKTCQQRTRLL